MVAICLGAIVTVKIGPVALLASVATLGQFATNPMFALWPFFGVIALGAFWFWAFARRASYGTGRVIVSILLALGILAISPLLFLGGVLTAVAGLAVGAGVLALVDMWLPRNALEPIAEHSSSP